MATSTHAFLSPSAAHRWMNCPASPSLESTVEDKGSIFAAEGSLAHAICEAKLHALIGPMTAGAYYIGANEGETWDKHELYKPEMEDHTDYYRDCVYNKLEEARQNTRDAKLIIEQTLDFRTWIPDGFGTADAIIIADGTMEVIDFKYGKGVAVSAHENPQMMIYALGALELYENDYDIRNIRMTIIQPRLDSVSDYEMTAGDLQYWGNAVLKPKAEEAYKCKDNPIVAEKTEQKAGPWCKFCAVKAQCKALADLAHQESTKHPTPNLLTEDEMAEILHHLPTIKSWLSAVEQYALDQAIDGTHYKGWKLVEGRSIRVITDAAELAARLKNEGYQDDAIYKPQELQTLTVLEKLVGKKTFSGISEGLIVKPQGKPTLAPESDKRKEWTSAADDFAGIEVE